MQFPIFTKVKFGYFLLKYHKTVIKDSPKTTSALDDFKDLIVFITSNVLAGNSRECCNILFEGSLISEKKTC